MSGYSISVTLLALPIHRTCLFGNQVIVLKFIKLLFNVTNHITHCIDMFVPLHLGETASEGLRQVAEWGATRHLENELKSKVLQFKKI